jgi:hypothetical protein
MKLSIEKLTFSDTRIYFRTTPNPNVAEELGKSELGKINKSK